MAIYANGIYLSEKQCDALEILAKEPRAWVVAGTLGKLRKLGLVGKDVARGHYGRQRTTSPITDAGRAWLDATKGDGQ